MNTTVLQVPRVRPRRKLAKKARRNAAVTSTELMKIVDDLRADLRSIENAIMAVECLAAIELGEDVSRKRGNRSGSQRKTGLIALRHSPPRRFDVLAAEAEQASGG
jgi:hypothetical protein